MDGGTGCGCLGSGEGLDFHGYYCVICLLLSVYIHINIMFCESCFVDH